MTSNNSLYLLGAAVVGIVSAAGIFIAEHFRQERRRHAMAQDLARIDQQLSGMRQELEQLRQLQKEKNAQRLKKAKRQATRAVSSLTSASDDYNSALDIDSSDLEFYDLSDEEDMVATSVPLEQTLKDLDDKLNSGDMPLIEEALGSLTDLRLKNPENAELMWRIGKAHHKIFSSATEKTVKQEHLSKGLAACEEAVKLNPDLAESHKWLAILLGAQCDTQPIKERIGGAYLFKQHLDAALALNPTDPTLHHLLGRFAYETASLKWYERKVAETFFAEPPTATFDEALQYALDAEKLTNNDWKENKLFLAKCQIALGKYEDAIESLVKADAMQDENCLDSTVESEIKTLLQKYNSYR